MFKIPTLLESVQRARARFTANLPGTDASIFPNNVGPSAKVVGGMNHEVFQFADYIQRQKFALTADDENLDMHGAEYGLTRKPAAPAGPGPIVLTATAGGLAVDAAALFQRSDGVQYRVLTSASIAGPGTLTVSAIAATDGANTSAIAGTDLEIISGVSGDTTATAEVGDGGIMGGLDVEEDGPYFTDDLGTFRGRILFRKRNPPHGGSAADYVRWATEVSGVTRVFVERLASGVGTVRVFPLFDNIYPNGLAPPGVIAAVSDYISQYQPSGARVTVTAPSPIPVDAQFAGVVPNTSTMQEAIKTELRDAFRRLSRVAGIDKQIGGMPYLAYPTSFSRSWIWQAAANAMGEERHKLNLPSDDIAQTAGQMPVIRNVSFV